MSSIDKVLYRKYDHHNSSNNDISTDIDTTIPLSSTITPDKSFTSTIPLRAFVKPTPIIINNDNNKSYSTYEDTQITNGIRSPKNSISPRNSYSPNNSPRNSYSPRESRSSRLYTTTRSTSPINERVVDTILNQVENGDLDTSIVDLIGEYPGTYQSPNVSSFGRSDKSKKKVPINEDNMMEYMTRMMEAMGEMMNGMNNNKKNIVRTRSRSRSRSRSGSPLKTKVSYSQDDSNIKSNNKRELETLASENDEVNISAHTSKTKIIELVLSRIQALEKTEKEVLRSLSSSNNNNNNSTKVTISHDTTENIVSQQRRQLHREQRRIQKNDISVLPNSHSQKGNENAIKSKFDNLMSYTNTKNFDNNNNDDDDNDNADNTLILQAPPISETFETSIMGQTQGKKQWEGTIAINDNDANDINVNVNATDNITPELLTLLGKHDKDRLNKRLTASERRQIEAIRELPYLPSLSYDSKIYFDEYVRDLARIRELKAVPWAVRGMDLVEVADKLTDRLTDTIIDEVTVELESFVNDYAEKFIDKI